MQTPPTDHPTAQLLHELPDGSAHVDWLLGQDSAGVEPLITYRLGGRIDDLEPGATIDAEHIGDHRPAYLTYEGPISGDRGTVRRLARGRIVARRRVSVSPAVDELEIVWGSASGEQKGARRQRIRLEQRDGPLWTVRILE